MTTYKIDYTDHNISEYSKTGYNAIILIIAFFIICTYYIFYAESLYEILSLLYSFTLFWVFLKTIGHYKISPVRHYFLFWIVVGMGMLHAIESYILVGVPNSRFQDDLLYHYHTSLLYSNFSNTPYSGYEYFLYFYGYPYYYITGIIPSIMILLPFNWLLITGSLVIVDILSVRLTKKICPTIIIVGLLICNYSFQFSAFRLYRDNLIIFLSLMYILLSLKRFYFFHPIIIYILFHLRGANAILLIYYTINHLLLSVFVKRKDRVFAFIIINIMMIILYPFFNLLIAKNFRHINSKKQENYQNTTIEILTQRSEDYALLSTGEGKVSNILKNLSYYGYPIRPIYTFLIVYRLRPIYDDVINTREAYGKSAVEKKNSFIITRIFSYFALFSLALYGKYLFHGLSNSIKSTTTFLLSIYIIISYILISIASMDSRHQLVCLIYMPFFVSVSISINITNNKLLNYSQFSILLAAIIAIVSTIQNLT